jgi:hypothetical protein
MVLGVVVPKSITRTRGEILTIMMTDLPFILSAVVNNPSPIPMELDNLHRRYQLLSLGFGSPHRHRRLSVYPKSWD